MAARSLVISSDPQVQKVWNGALHEIGIEVQCCWNALTAMDRVGKGSYQIVITDVETSGADSLRCMREFAAETSAVIVGLVKDPKQAEDATQHGANFVLPKPLTIEDARRILEISHAERKKQVRRYMRLTVDAPVQVHLNGTHTARLLDVSASGALIATDTQLLLGQVVDVKFRLPGVMKPITSRASVCWIDDSKHEVGLQFESDDQTFRTLGEWTRERAHRALGVEECTIQLNVEPESGGFLKKFFRKRA